MKKAFLTLTTLATLTTLSLGVASADVTACKPIYGGGTTCLQAKDFTVDKRVQNPKTQKFVDNLPKDEINYNADANISFAITVKNSSEKKLSNITVTDTFPKYLSFVEGQGTFDKEKNTLTFSIKELGAGEEKTFIIKTKVANADKLPSKTEISCMANLAEAKVNNNTGADNAQFCVQPAVSANGQKSNGKTNQTVEPLTDSRTKGGLAVMPEPKTSVTPATGPEALALLTFISTGVTGFLLRKRS